MARPFSCVRHGRGKYVQIAPAIALIEEQKAERTRLSRSGGTSVRRAQRGRTSFLLAAQGLQNRNIAEATLYRARASSGLARAGLQAGVEAIERDRPQGTPPVKVNVAELV